MIYVSSSCVKARLICEAVEILVAHGYRNIELSGGTAYYEDITKDLLALKNRYDLSYICHNYFPPPEEDFVINLASANDGTYQRSIDHLVEAIQLSSVLGANVFGFHAGFLVDLDTSEAGRKVAEKKMFPETESIERFFTAFTELKHIAEDLGIRLYVENNVISGANYQNYNGRDFLLLTHSEEYFKLREKYKFDLLLDLGHLQVSAHTLGLDIENEFQKLAKSSNYWHISDNSLKADENMCIKKGGILSSFLKACHHRPDYITLEIYEGLEQLSQSHALVRTIFD